MSSTHLKLAEPTSTNSYYQSEGDNQWNVMQVDESTQSDDGEMEESDGTKLAINASWAVNWFLLFAKAFVVIVSGSKAVTASLADSGVDLASQGVLALADKYISIQSPKYPVGRSRLEALSVIACAFIMMMASIEGKYHNYPFIRLQF